MDERFQFRRLLRGFSYRFLDNEFTSAEGDTAQTTVHAVALLGALSVSLSMFFVYKYAMYISAALNGAGREAASWPDKQFLISLAMSVIGLAVVVTWDALFPDRRDCLTLSSLPVRARTIFAAKICSVLVVFGVITVSLNLATTLLLPTLLTLTTGTAGFFRYAFAHVVAIFSASTFVFASLLSIQGLLINVLSFRLYKSVSTWVQLAALFAILCMFFLTPNVAYPPLLADPRNHLVIRLAPAFWFLGLYQELLGSSLPEVHKLASLARAGLGVSVLVAVAAYSVGYNRYFRKTVEEADTVTSGRRSRASFASRWIDRFLLSNPIERAVFHFGARTMARNRKHRLLLTIYAGLGLSYVFHGASWVIRTPHLGRARLFEPGISSVPLILAFFVLFGMRMLFTIPVELRSNWIFQLTENGRPAEYLAGVRKLMILAGIVPPVLCLFPVYGYLWGWVYALRHVVLVVLILLVVLEYLVADFPKIPFTCSFLPGKANLKATVGIYVTVFVVFALIISAVELALVRSEAGYWKGVLAIGLVLGYRAWRRNQWERRLPGFTYEEKALVASLDLRG